MVYYQILDINDLPNEEWKVLIYNGIEYPNYLISNLGRIKSIKGNLIRKQYIGTNGYCQLHLTAKSHIMTHRAVACTFIPLIQNKNDVNHIDEDRLNNTVNNLEWCDKKYNNNYGLHNENMSKARKQYFIDNPNAAKEHSERLKQLFKNKKLQNTL